MKHLLRLLAIALMVVAPAYADTPISQMTNGGTVQTTDMIPVARCSYAGCNYRVTVGPITPLNIGAGLASSGSNLILDSTQANSWSGLQTFLSGDLTAADPIFTGGSARLPSGATSLRPSSPVNGEIRYNTDTTALEAYVGGAWGSVGSSSSGSSGTIQIAGSSGSFGSYPGLSCAAHRWIISLDPTGASSADCVQPGFADLSGSLSASQMPAGTGDVSWSAGTTVTTLATVNTNVGTFGSASSVPQITVDAKGRVTAASSVSITPSAIGAPTATGTGASGTWGISISGNAATVTTNANLSGDVTSVGNTTTLPATVATGKALTGFSSTTGAITASDTILSAIEKLYGNAQALVVNLASQVTGILPLANGGSAASTVGGAQANLGVIGPILANACGDSITERHSTYFPTGYGSASGVILPVWQTGTVYPANYTVQSNSGLVYQTSAGGTSGAGPIPGGGGSDGGVSWALETWQSVKGSDYLTWLEYYANGSIVWDQNDGYATIPNGAGKIDIKNPGTGYGNSDTMSCNGGAAATPTFSGGQLVSATITQPGVGNIVCTINTSTGSGALYTVISGGGGTFGVPGTWTIDAVIRLPDMVASRTQLFFVHDGTNDVANNVSYAIIIANLQNIYETLRAAGKRVIAIPILPRGTGLTEAQALTAYRVNKWIRAYARMEKWANPNQVEIGLADPTGYFTDGTVLTSVNNAVGGTGGTASSMTEEGLHPNNRGMQYMGYSAWLAAKQMFNIGAPDYSARNYTSIDAYDYVVNPSGNMLEGILWQASQPVVLGSVVNNGGKSYYCTQAGTTASSGGPTGTGTGITDGTAKWNYRWPAYMSTWASGTAGTQTAATGIVYSGNLASGWTIVRNAGSASGTVTLGIESPWSNGQAGQRQTLAFSLGSGTSNEQWILYTSNVAPANWGVTAADLGVTKYYAEAELEISSMANMTDYCSATQL